MKKVNPNSVIIYYDSIIDDGSLCWQSGLTNKNITFLKYSDYFFSDYKWNLT